MLDSIDGKQYLASRSLIDSYEFKFLVKLLPKLLRLVSISGCFQIVFYVWYNKYQFTAFLFEK